MPLAIFFSPDISMLNKAHKNQLAKTRFNHIRSAERLWTWVDQYY